MSNIYCVLTCFTRFFQNNRISQLREMDFTNLTKLEYMLVFVFTFPLLNAKPKRPNSPCDVCEQRQIRNAFLCDTTLFATREHRDSIRVTHVGHFKFDFA